MSYRITTDSTCDMPLSYYREHDIPVIGLRYHLDGAEYLEGSDGALSTAGFYNKLRAGSQSSTAQVTAFEFTEFAEPYLQAGEDVLHLCFSSGLSGTYSSCNQAAGELREKYPERTIEVVDSLAASMGEGLLLDYIVKNRAAGMPLADNAKWLADNRLHLCHWFTVDDLMHLHRGGRVSKTSAVLGSLLGIKPVLHVDDTGHLILMSKARGRAAAISALAQKVKTASFDNIAGQTVFISHGDCESDANLLADELRRGLGIKDILISSIGAVIGSHSGAGTIAVFFMGPAR